ncbi:MAG: alpha-L-fucosidase [Rhodothermales bacterium]|nr:alpha-L-fucosidase [Rhodothermales bacterium]
MSTSPLVVYCLLALLLCAAPVSAQQVSPPAPILPIPTARQLAWQEGGMRMFVHFGVNTFTDREWGDGTESPDLFQPAGFDARQWARVARETGFSTVILTAKHHDGFALWNSRYTDHDVASSSWMGGGGDVVGALAEAVREEGLGLGLYLSPWDQHEPSYGDEAGYNAFYLAQLRELLTQYGPITEMWFDGAKGENAKAMNYHFHAFWATVRQLQPGAVLFSDAGPDVRWIGNERGFAGESSWSTFDRSKVSIGATGIEKYLNEGDADGPDWVGGECDVSIRRGWFFHADQEPKSVADLMDIYYKSEGRNCVLLLNIPPNRAGLLDDADVRRLQEFKAAREAVFTNDLARGATAMVSNQRGGDDAFGPAGLFDDHMETYWATDDTVRSASVIVDLPAGQTFNVIRLNEPIHLGQRVRAYRVEAEGDGQWSTLVEGTTIGYRKLDRIATTTAGRLRITLLDARGCPLLAGFGLYLDTAL